MAILSAFPERFWMGHREYWIRKSELQFLYKSNHFNIPSGMMVRNAFRLVSMSRRHKYFFHTQHADSTIWYDSQINVSGYPKLFCSAGLEDDGALMVSSDLDPV
jgi:hypothetical protein